MHNGMGPPSYPFALCPVRGQRSLVLQQMRKRIGRVNVQTQPRTVNGRGFEGDHIAQWGSGRCTQNGRHRLTVQCDGMATPTIKSWRTAAGPCQQRYNGIGPPAGPIHRGHHHVRRPSAPFSIEGFECHLQAARSPFIGIRIHQHRRSVGFEQHIDHQRRASDHIHR